MRPYYLGCPIWSNKDWTGEFFTRKAKAHEYLGQYASVFKTVEGNTTFYALPKPDTVKRWRDETPEDFRFCLKFPRTITHEKRLLYADRERDYFFELFAPLQSRLGPFFLQLPPTFGGQKLRVLEQFLDTLPSEFSYAVEVRNGEYFQQGYVENEFEKMLRARGIDRVLMDSRGVHSDRTPEEHASRTRSQKPLLPERFVALHRQPFVRYISHPTLEDNEPFFSQWVEVVARWIEQGKRPFVFIHVPNNFYAPRFARRFHQKLQLHLPHLDDLPAWPAELEPKLAEQLSLF